MKRQKCSDCENFLLTPVDSKCSPPRPFWLKNVANTFWGFVGPNDGKDCKAFVRKVPHV